MVDIIVGVIPPVHNNTSQRDQRNGSFAKKKRPVDKKHESDADPREPEAEGDVVTLSYKNKRRRGMDRRKKSRPAELVYRRP